MYNALANTEPAYLYTLQHYYVVQILS